MSPQTLFSMFLGPNNVFAFGFAYEGFCFAYINLKAVTLCISCYSLKNSISMYNWVVYLQPSWKKVTVA